MPQYETYDPIAWLETRERLRAAQEVTTHIDLGNALDEAIEVIDQQLAAFMLARLVSSGLRTRLLGGQRAQLLADFGVRRGIAGRLRVPAADPLPRAAFPTVPLSQSDDPRHFGE